MITPRPDSMGHANVFSVRLLIDHRIMDIENKLIGVISDVVFEMNNGMLAFVRVSLKDGRVLVVPYDAIEIDPTQDKVRLKMYSESIQHKDHPSH